MKLFQLLSFCFLSLVVSNVWAQQTFNTVEVPVEHVFIPKTGYDSNDDVHMFVEVMLPNRCYTILDKAIAPKEEVGGDKTVGVYHYRQYAFRRTDGVCNEKELSKPENAIIAMPWRRSATIRLFKDLVDLPNGNVQTVKPGNYKIVFRGADQIEKVKEFFVDLAETAAVDNMDYADVQFVNVEPTIKEGAPVGFFVTVLFRNSCQTLDAKDVDVSRRGDVILVVPKLPPVPVDAQCAAVLISHTVPVEMKESLPPGRYLIHTRSEGGKAFNNPFSIENIK